MNEVKDVNIGDLVGEHTLTGVDRENIRVKEVWGDVFNDCQSISFVLDGIVYTAVEDPSDGYRSSMESLRTGGTYPKNKFKPIKCVGTMRGGGKDEVLQLIDIETGKIIIEVGTADSDDYYPSFVANYMPENMEINIGR